MNLKISLTCVFYIAFVISSYIPNVSKPRIVLESTPCCWKFTMKWKATYIQMIWSNNFCDTVVNVASQFYLLTDTLECGYFQIPTQEAFNQYLKIVFVYILQIAFRNIVLLKMDLIKKRHNFKKEKSVG